MEARFRLKFFSHPLNQAFRFVSLFYTLLSERSLVAHQGQHVFRPKRVYYTRLHSDGQIHDYSVDVRSCETLKGVNI